MGLATDPAYAAYYHGYSNGLATEVDWTTTLWCTYDCPFTEHLNVLHPMKSTYGWDTVLEICEPSICLQYHIEKFQHSVYVQSACHVFFSTHCIWIGISVCALGSPMPGCGWAPMQHCLWSVVPEKFALSVNVDTFWDTLIVTSFCTGSGLM